MLALREKVGCIGMSQEVRREPPFSLVARDHQAQAVLAEPLPAAAGEEERALALLLRETFTPVLEVGVERGFGPPRSGSTRSFLPFPLRTKRVPPRRSTSVDRAADTRRALSPCRRASPGWPGPEEPKASSGRPRSSSAGPGPRSARVEGAFSGARRAGLARGRAGSLHAHRGRRRSAGPCRGRHCESRPPGAASFPQQESVRRRRGVRARRTGRLESLPLLSGRRDAGGRYGRASRPSRAGVPRRERDGPYRPRGCARLTTRRRSETSTRV